MGDVVDRCPEIVTGHDGFDGLPDRLQSHGGLRLGRLQQHPHRGGQLAGVPAHLGVAADLLLFGLPVGLRQQVVLHEDVEQLQGVVGRLGL